ncbi:hypothetical protein ACFVZM_32045 [Streptomyces sioyaensis]|uniref:hypothetical protein n=1 Tax=Streptomyces sioyaensis TaxID=67364 RepID=UPI003673EC8C
MPLTQLRAAALSDGFGHRLTYTGTDIRGLSALVAAGAGLTVASLPTAGGLPGIAAVPITEPRIVHRTEVLHPRTPTAPAAELVDTLRPAQ